MKRILAIAILSFLFTPTGCVAGPNESPSESVGGPAALAGAPVSAPNVASGLPRDASPGVVDVARKLTSEVRLAEELSRSEPEALDYVKGTYAQSGTNIIIACNRKCVLGCGDIGDAACAYSCCIVW
ncbi:MAG: hypothetical protein ACXVDD_02610 [Polyangia bacterium]